MINQEKDIKKVNSLQQKVNLYLNAFYFFLIQISVLNVSYVFNDVNFSLKI